MAYRLDRSELFKLARLGAPARLAELRHQIRALEGLVGREERPDRIARRRRRRRGKLSAAGRAAISAAQKRRWAAIKAKKKAT